MSKPGFTPYITVYTKGGNGTEDRRFFPAAIGPVRTSTIASVLAAIEMYNSTGDVKVELAMQDSDDGQAWPAANTFSVLGTLSVTSDTTTYDDTYRTISTSKAFCRLGYAVRNNTGATRELALISGRFELKPH